MEKMLKQDTEMVKNGGVKDLYQDYQLVKE
jgi:hypothetical protein